VDFAFGGLWIQITVQAQGFTVFMGSDGYRHFVAFKVMDGF
jgi:hypothetical protein